MKRNLMLVLMTALILPARLSFGGMLEVSEPVYFQMGIEKRGEVTFMLYTNEAPKTTARIIELIQKSFYTGQKFHKVVRQPRPFLAQIGDPNSKTKKMDDASLGSYSTGTKIAYENSGYKHVKGAIGMSRLEDSKDTGDTQFYFMLDSYSFLDGQYTVFGQVVKGLEILDTIELGDKVTGIKQVERP